MKAVTKTGVLGTTITFSNDVAVATPQLKPDSVLVKVHAAAINPIDYKLPKFASSLIAGQDFCGEVVESHPESEFAVGDRVFGLSKGTLADFTLASPKAIAKAPENWKASDCAALTTAYWSALQSLAIGGILPNQDNTSKSVLVIGASGGCGLAGIQLSASMGVSRIVGICSSKNADMVKQQGATEIVDYTDAKALQNFFKDNRGQFDCVYDTATYSGGGADYWKDSIPLLKEDDQNAIIGEYASLNGPASKWVRAMAGAQTKHETIVMMEPRGPELDVIAQLMEKSKAKPITTIMKFDEEGIRDGFKLLKSRRAKGKIVFDICASEN